MESRAEVFNKSNKKHRRIIQHFKNLFSHNLVMPPLNISDFIDLDFLKTIYFKINVLILFEFKISLPIYIILYFHNFEAHC